MSRFRFVHTSDIHLETSLSGAGFSSQLGDRKREAIRSTFRGILEGARGLPADIVLVAGDLFEHDRVTPDTVAFLKQQFESLGRIRVFIAPGNHDPCIQGSPYLEESWPENVHIFRDEEFKSVDLPELGARVTGFGFRRTHLTRHHFRDLQALPGGAFNIVLSHGSDAGRVPPGKACHGPFLAGEIAGKNVHYCALGHYHQQRRVECPDDGTVIWYSGIPEGRGWDEEGDGAYLQAEVEEMRLSVQSVPCGRYPLRTVTLDCEGFSSREQIVDALLALPAEVRNPATILRVKLIGTVDPGLEMSMTGIAERLSGEVLKFAWEDRTQPATDFEALARQNTLQGRFVKLLDGKIALAEGEERAVLERCRLYGTQALMGGDVRPR